MNENETLILDIVINLDELVASEIEKAGLLDSLTSASESTIQETMTALGIPGTARVELLPGIPPEWTPALLAVTANEQSLISLPGGENRLLAVTLGRLLQPGEGGPALPAWLSGQFQSGVTGEANPGIRYLARLAQAVLTADLSILLGKPQAVAVQNMLAGLDSEEPLTISAGPEWLEEILRTLLKAHISLAGLDQLAGAVRSTLQAGAAQAAEAVLAALLPQSIGVRLPRFLLEAYTLTDEQIAAALPPDADPSASPFLLLLDVIKQIFTFQGLNLPALEFEVTDSREQSISFRINNLPGPAWPALPPDTALVDAQPEQIAPWGVDAVPALHPEDGRLCSQVGTLDAVRLVENGFVAWHGMHYLALSFASHVNAYRTALVDNQSVETWLNKLNDLSPELVKAIKEEYGGEMQAVLTRTLRRLVELGISMNRLPQVLDELLNPRVLSANAETHVIIGIGMPVSPEVAASDWRSNPLVLADCVIRSIT